MQKKLDYFNYLPISQLKLRVYFLLGMLVFFASCAHKKRKWVMELPLQDVVSHTFLNSLGVNTLKIPNRIYDDDLAPFVDQFVADAKKRGVLIPDETREKLRQVVYVSKLSMRGGPGVMASCNRYFSTQATLSGKKTLNWMTIEVLREESQEYTGTGPDSLILLRELMYHEIFHCLLNKGHLPKNLSGIMSPTLIKGDKRAFTKWDQLLDDMFSQEYISAIPDAT